ncbi:hypothetical protein GuL6_135 [Buttiauxella phage vB_ButM_GuL6]|nr:hypothetical protein GuL6_135 [Buttiauxella phage vB_ButM_GuL6]
MKTAIIRTTEDVDSTTTLTIGDRVLIGHSKSIESNSKFILQSIAKEKEFKVYVFVTESVANRSTLIMKVGSGEPSLLIGGSVNSVTVTSMSIGSKDCAPNGENELCYTAKKRQNVERPVMVGDLFRSSRREYIVEYIAKDGSLVCRMYSVSSKEFIGMMIIDGTDARVLESLHVTLRFINK